MKLVATAGLQWDKAILEYLVRGNHEIELGRAVKRQRGRAPAKEESESA